MMSHALIPLTDNATRIVAGLGCSEIFFRPGGQPGKTHKKKNETSQEPWLALLYRRKAPRAPVNPRIRARVASTRSRCANQQVNALFSPGNTHIDPPPLTPIAKSHLTEI